jgi:signal transduction histidine kinase
MALHLLLEKRIGPLTSRQNELLETARDDSERLLRILNDLLDLTRLEEGNTDLYKEMTPPADMVQGAADIMRESVANRQFRLVCRIEPDLPPVLVDRQRINHVFTNFIENAAKYSPPGGEIVIAARRTEEREVQFSVADQGPGVPEDQQDRIFDRFYRVPGQPKKGAGLGLSIAREIVLTHGGRIGVRNGPNGGSEFYFVLAGEDAVGVTNY